MGFIPELAAGFYQQALFAQDFVCLAASGHPRIGSKLNRKAFSNEGHIMPMSSGTGHSMVDKVLANNKVERRVVLRVPSFLGVARIVAQTEFLVIVPRQLGHALAEQERVKVLEPPCHCPPTKSNSIGTSATTWMLAISGCATPWRGFLRARGWMFEALKWCKFHH